MVEKISGFEDLNLIINDISNSRKLMAMSDAFGECFFRLLSFQALLKLGLFEFLEANSHF